MGLIKVFQATAGKNHWIDPSKYPKKYPKYHVITAIVVNPPERKLAKRTSVQCRGLISVTI